MTQPALTEDQAQFIQGPLSIVAASRDIRRVPSVARASACRVSDDRRRVTLLLPAQQCRQLLADIAATRAIAVVFTEPSSHRTLQFKGSDAAESPLADGDMERVRVHLRAFAEEIVPLGHARELALTVHDVPGGELTPVTFSIDAIFEQTPGPKAGTRMDK